MKIIITPEDIVKRCLWDTYTYYIVRSEKKAEDILMENKPFELSERDAIVIGLLKVMETDNLIHRFNDHIVHFLNLKSLTYEDKFYVKKNHLEKSIELFMNKFPEYWNPVMKYRNALFDLKLYIKEVSEGVENIEVVKTVIKQVNCELIKSSSVKKLLNFNYY